MSFLALGLAYACGTMVLEQGGEFHGFALLLAWLAAIALTVPRLELRPTHPGPTITEKLLILTAKNDPKVIPPVWIAGGAVALASGLLWLTAQGEGQAGQFLTVGILATLTLALIFGTTKAEGLADLALPPAVALMGMLQAYPLFLQTVRFDRTVTPEASLPMEMTVVLGLATAISFAAFWRSFRGTHRLYWALGAILYAPVSALVLELVWTPATYLGDFPWAAHIIALAALMVFFAERYARTDGENHRRAAWATMSALSLIAFAMFILLSQAALTVALSVLILTAAILDRRFRLPEMGWFILAGTLVLGWRLVADPGLLRYVEDAPLIEVLVAFGSALLALALARIALPEDDTRGWTRRLLQSGIWGYGGVFASILLHRLLDALDFNDAAATASLFGMMWASVALAQTYQARKGARLPVLSWLLVFLFSLPAIIAFGVAISIVNPAFGSFLGGYPEGPYIFDTLFVAYALPGLAALVLAARAEWLPWKPVFRIFGGLFTATYVFLEIRRFWHGDLIDLGYGFNQPELYTYTVALLLIGGGLLYQAIAKRSTGLRRLAMTVIALAVAKVFLIDASGLTGLLRVFSFLALGLVLAGLAWLNRWAMLQGKAEENPPPDADP